MLKVNVEGAHELIMMVILNIYEFCFNLNIMYLQGTNIKLPEPSHNN